jgi:hypothetical protein
MGIRGQAAEEARILTMADEVQEELDLGWATIIHRFSSHHADGDERVACHTTVDWEYRQAGMLWYVRETMAESDLNLRRIIVHEMVHVMLAPMESLVDSSHLKDKVCELAVENVTRAIMEILPCPE